MASVRCRVALTGIGVVTPIGTGVDALWRSVREGRAAVRRLTRFDASPYRSQLAAEIDGFDPAAYAEGKQARRLDRFSALAVAAGTGAALAHRHWSDVGLWASWLAPAPLVFLALFLFSSPVSGLVQGGDVDPADLGAFGSADPPPVVMLVFDEWPLASIVRSDGTIDADLYPNVAALASARTRPSSIRSVVLLPAPLGPRKPVSRPGATEKLSPETASTLPKRLLRLSISIICVPCGSRPHRTYGAPAARASDRGIDLDRSSTTSG